MAKLEIALENLKKVIVKSKSKSRTLCEETIGQLSSYLVFLKSNVLSHEAANKLSKCLRERLVHIYAAFPQPGIELAAAICQTLYESKILTEFTAGNDEQKSLWERVLNALLSGVLDFYDEKPNAKHKEAIGVALYPTLCSTFFSISISHMSIDLRCTGYSILSETADSHEPNRARLHDGNILGGTRLGSILWRTRDFLVLESILNLFARMIPATGGTTAGKAARSAFIRSVFVESSPDCAETGEILTKVLEKVRTADWDHTAAKIVDILSSSNIAFPQPFAVSEVLACDQRKSTDRLYVDEKGFVANILLDDDACDSLSVPYSAVCGIKVAQSSPTHDKKEFPISHITVSLKSLPVIGKDPITPRTSTEVDVVPTICFSLKKSDISRFRQALNSRGMSHALNADMKVKLSVLTSPANLEMDTTGKLVENTDLAQRIDNLSQLYGTNDPSDELPKDTEDTLAQPVGPLSISKVDATGRDANVIGKSDESFAECAQPGRQEPERPGRSNEHCDLQAVEDPGQVEAASSPAVVRATRHGFRKGTPGPVTPLRPTRTQAVRELAFGTSDEELSDIEADLVPPKPHVQQIEDTKKPKVLKSRRVVDSDEGLPSTPTRPPIRRATRRNLMVVSDGEDEIEEVLPASKISSTVITRRRSTLTMAPVLASHSSGLPDHPIRERKATVSGDVRSAAQNSGKNFEDVVFSNKGKNIQEVGDDEVMLSPAVRIAISATGQKISVDVPSSKVSDSKLPRKLDEHNELDSLQIASSSPAPLKLERKSVKAALRKKGGALVDSTQSPSHVKRPKRKRSLNPAAEAENMSVHDEDELLPDLVKRRKGLSEAGNESMKAETTETSIAPSAARTIKRYGGRKARTTSPASASLTTANYDRVPDTPPVAVVNPCENVIVEKKRIKPRMITQAKAESTVAPALPEAIASITAKPNSRLNRKLDITYGTESSETVQVSRQPEAVNTPTIVCEPAKDSANTLTANIVVQIEDFAREIATNDTTHSSTPKPQRRKSNKKPWKGTTAISEAQQEPIAELPTIKVVDVQEETVLPAEPEAAETIELPTASPDNVVAEIQMTSDLLGGDMTVSSASIPDSPRSVKLPETSGSDIIDKKPLIDLTSDSPVKKIPQIVAPLMPPDYISATTDRPTLPRQNKLKPSVKFAPDLLEAELIPISPIKPTSVKSMFQKTKSKSTSRMKGLDHNPSVNVFSREIATPTMTTTARAQSPSVENIASVLNEIHEALLRKIHSKVEGVRADVRSGRERLMADAVSDLMRMRSESITRYNLLIELEAEYASFGRNVVYGLEDLLQVNRKIEDEVKKIIQDHNRGSISKKAPATLLSAPLPASILAFSN